MGKYQVHRYPVYKDSGSEIIKAIPAHWDFAPLKFIGNIILGKMLTPQDKGGYVEKPYLRAKNIGWETVDDEDINTMWFSQYELEQYRLKQNDLLISEGGEVGRTAIWNSELDECYIQNSVHKVTINQGHNPRYYLYHSQVFGKTGYYDSIVNRVSIGHLTGEKLKDIRFVVPPFPEQQAIADFLDRKTAQIDALIEKKQRQIDLLHEQRTVLINHAVTKGLNPKVKMKDSGVEWLGEIPSHWDVNIKLTMLAEDTRNSFVNGPFGSNLLVSELTESGVPVIYIKDVRNGIYKRKSTEYVTPEKALELDSCRVDPGDILIAKVGDPPGATAVYPDGEPSGIVTQDVIRIKLKTSIVLPQYFALFLNSEAGRAVVGQVTIESTRSRIPLGDFKNVRIPLPPINEQIQIIEKLSGLLSQSDKAEELSYRLIERLQEYRTALISEAVTGKVDVR